MKVAGIRIWEFVALFLLLGAAYCGELYGARYGTGFAILGMITFPIGLMFLIQGLAWLERELVLGQPPFPACPCGLGPIDGFNPESLGSRTLLLCDCGRVFENRYVGRLVVLEDGRERDFAKWHPFRGWGILPAPPSGQTLEDGNPPA